MSYNLNNVVCMESNKTVYKDGDYLIKVFEDETEVSKILTEALNQQRVMETTDLNIPKLLEVTKINDKWAIVMEYIDGVNLEQYLETHPEKEDQVLQLLINTQLKVLGYRVPLLKRSKEKYAYKISVNEDLDDEQKKDLLGQLEKLKIHSKLCHGDLSLSNVVVKKDGTVWVLDWTHAYQGNASTDACKTYLTLLVKNKELANKYLHMFVEKSKIELDHIKTWLPIVAGGEAYINKVNVNNKDLLKEINNI